MSEQRTLAGYKSKINEGTDFENPNEGKPLLNEDDEYILRLTRFPHVITRPQEKKRKDGTVYTIQTEKAVCEFEDTTTKNIITAFFRVDSINFSEDESFDSGIVRFFRKIGHPLVDGQEPRWEDYFVVGMRFRARVIVDRERDITKKPTGKYYLDVPTCRKLMASDMTEQPEPSKSDGTLLNALLLAKGAKDHNEAMDKLNAAGASKELAMALFNANLDGLVKYPI
jgi:hypothetical protein